MTFPIDIVNLCPGTLGINLLVIPSSIPALWPRALGDIALHYGNYGASEANGWWTLDSAKKKKKKTIHNVS